MLATFFAETDAKIRGDLSNILKKLTSRLLLVINKLHRSSANARQDAVYNQRMLVFDDSILILHTQFVEWFYSFLCTEMLPSASYQRHLMALKTLTMESTLELLYTCKVGLCIPLNSDRDFCAFSRGLGIVAELKNYYPYADLANNRR